MVTSIRDDFLGIFDGARNFNLVRIGLHLQNDFFFFLEGFTFGATCVGLKRGWHSHQSGDHRR